MKRQAGFSLVELMVAMVVFVLVIAAASGIFIPLTNQFKQQSKIAETNIEGLVGLELLRVDIEHAGYGLPWLFQNPIIYSEAASAPASNYNDSPSNPPRAIMSGDNVTFNAPNNIFNGSDYLVIKSANVARSDTAQRWSYIVRNADYTTTVRAWTAESLENNNRVIVIKPKVSDIKFRELIMNGATFFTRYSAPFSPTKPSEAFLIYGVDPDTDLRMPFNRADYYILRGSTNPATDDVPDRCAQNTGVLRKAIVNHGAGTFQGGILPLLDCVADMQVIYRLDMNEDGVVGTITNANGSTVSSNEGASVSTVQATFLDVALHRNRLKEVRVYILAHEGQRDTNYTFANFTAGACATCIRVGEPTLPALGRDFDLSTIPNYLNYRWKVYTLVVKPQNLR